MSSELDNKVKEEIPRVDFKARIIGMMLSTGDIMAIFLSLEDQGQRLDILVELIKTFGISLEDVTDMYLDKPCSKCGTSMFLHKNNNGECF